jgi:hypothetical protein
MVPIKELKAFGREAIEWKALEEGPEESNTYKF